MTVDRRFESGSVLLLFPAAFMVMLILGSLAIDAGVVFLGQRDLAAAAGAAANDAATLGLDLGALRTEGELRLDHRLVESAVASALARRGVLGGLTSPPEVTVEGDQIVVTLTRHVDYVIAPALPNGPRGRTVSVTVRSRAVIDE